MPLQLAPLSHGCQFAPDYALIVRRLRDMGVHWRHVYDPPLLLSTCCRVLGSGEGPTFSGDMP
jgi:uncharacterized membrane protein YhaH (DUF805 family)